MVNRFLCSITKLECSIVKLRNAPEIHQSEFFFIHVATSFWSCTQKSQKFFRIFRKDKKLKLNLTLENLCQRNLITRINILTKKNERIQNFPPTFSFFFWKFKCLHAKNSGGYRSCYPKYDNLPTDLRLII
jgi:hypothetical protein